MKMQSKVIIIGMETYTSQKSGKTFAKVLLVDEGGTNAVTVMSEDLTIMAQPLYTPIKCVFDYIEKYKQLSLLAFDPVSAK